MPTATKYTYSIASDFPGGAVNTTNLTAEIQASSIVTALDRIDTAGDVIDIWFKDALSTGDKTTLDNDATGPAGGLIAVHDNSATIQPIEQVSLSHKKTTGDLLRVAIEKSDSESYDIFSHNWCDKTTWYLDALRVEDEVATTSDNTIYSVVNNNLIDTYHGKITQEDFLTDSNSNSYRVVVKVNDVVQTEQDPHLGSGGDYTVDYTNGDVIFQSALTGSDVVKVTYHYAQTSVLKIIPPTGKKVSIEVAEVQFSTDVEITDTVIFETFGLVDVFAPQLMPGIPSGTKISLKKFVYKTIRDYQNAAFKAYPTYPAIGGNTWRGMTQPVIVLDWDYQRALDVHSAYGMEVHLYLEHDVPFNGTYATATLYCGLDTDI